MGYTDDDWLAINTIRILAVGFILYLSAGVLQARRDSARQTAWFN
jgi:hypothetical protein